METGSPTLELRVDEAGWPEKSLPNPTPRSGENLPPLPPWPWDNLAPPHSAFLTWALGIELNRMRSYNSQFHAALRGWGRWKVAVLHLVPDTPFRTLMEMSGTYLLNLKRL